MLSVLAFILSILVGFALAVCITSFLVSRSNDHGSNKGEFKDFSRHPMHFIEEKDNIRKPVL